MTTFADHDTPKTKAGLAERIIDGEALLVNAQGGEILVLNEPGAFIWQLLDGKRDVAALVACVCDEYAVEEAIASADVRAFLDALASRGALEGA